MGKRDARSQDALSRLRARVEDILSRKHAAAGDEAICEITRLLDRIEDAAPRGVHAGDQGPSRRAMPEEYRQLAVDVLAILNRPNSLATVVEDLLRLIKRSTDVEAIGLRLREGDDYPYYVQDGFSADFVARENKLCTHDDAGQIVRDAAGQPILECMCGLVLHGQTDPGKPFFTKGGSFWTNGTTALLASTSDQDRGAHTRNRCNREGYESVALIPFRLGRDIAGLLQLNDRRPGRFGLEMIEFLEGIGESIGIAIARKREVEQWRRISSRDEAILAAIPNILMQVDANKVYTWANKAGLEFFGPDVVGKEAAAFFVGPQNVYAKIRPILAGDEGVMYLESWQRRSDGAQRLLAWWCRVLKDADGKVSGALSAAQDITEQRQAEDALRDSEARSRFLSEILEHSSQPFAVGHPDGSVGYFNTAFCDLLGYSRRELAAMSWNKELTAPQWQHREAQALAEIERTGRPGRYEKEYVRKDGSRVPVELLVHQVRDKNGALEYYYAFVTDLTERKLAEKALRDSEAQLLQAQKMEAIGLLAGGVAHDFRNQLTVIKGYGEMLIRRGLTEGKAAEYVGQILKAADRSTQLSGQLLAFSRQQDLHPEVVDLNELIGDLSKSLGRLVGEDVQSCIVPGHDLGAVKIDPARFQQAMINLIINARDAMPNGGQLTIETANAAADDEFIRRHAGASPGPYVAVVVTDTGTGMSSDTLKHVFEPFFTTKPVGQGTGLGLAMVYGFVKQSGGYISAHSEEGKGTAFRIYLPRAQEAPRGKTSADLTAELPRGVGTILVVEDEASIREVLGHTLRDCGYTVLEAASAQEALPLGEHYEGRIDLLITDVVMPGLSGPEIAARIASVRPGLPVLYISGYTGRTLANRGVVPRDAHLLTKPLGSQVLAETVKRIMGGG